MDIKDAFTIFKNGIIRYKNKIFPPEEGCDYIDLPENYKGKYPPTVMGKKIHLNDRWYIASESVLLDEFQFGVRSREEYSSINSEGAILPTLTPIVKFQDRDPKWISLMGVDRNGRLKVGHWSEFDNDYLVALTFCNRVKDFALDDNGNVYKERMRHITDATVFHPKFYLHSGGSGHLNMLIFKDKPDTTLGIMSGGRVIIKCEDEVRLAVGSIDTVYRIFKDMKERHNSEYCDLYLIDNGTYSIGLRTFDQIITEQDLKEYDCRNTIGGHFFYIKNQNNENT